MGNTYHEVLVSTEYGGAAEILVRLATHLHSEQGERTTVWIPGPGRAWDKVTRLGLPIRPYNAQRLMSRSRFTSGLANLRLGLQLRKQRPGLIHVNDPFFYAALRHGLNLAGMKTVVHVQIEHNLEGLRWAFRHPPDLIIACAAFLEDHVRQTLPVELRERQRIAVVPNSVDIVRFQPGDKLAAKQKLGTPLDRPLVLMLANLAEHKGQETTIRAVAELKTRGTPVSAWLAGVEREPGSRYQAKLEALIDSLDLKQDVRLLGFRDDAPLLLQAADVMLLPSTKEGLPLTIVEAQAAKIPVIASPTAGVPEVIEEGVTGFLVAADDVRSYANRIEQVVKEPTRLQSLLENAYRQATTKYNWEECRDQMCELYRQLLGPNAASSNGR